jgi:predicted nucleotidyltransferase
MNIDFGSLNQKEIIERVNEFLQKDFLGRFPEIKDIVALIVVGSIANDDYDKFSDVDINVLLPESVDNNPYVDYKEELRSKGSQIELRFARNYEVLEKYLNWNDDFILGEYQNCVVLHDPTNRFTKLIRNFQWYPKDILQNKIDWLIHEIKYSIHHELKSLIQRSDTSQFFLLVIKNKLIRYFLTMIRLYNNRFPVHDKRLYTTTIKQCPKDFGVLKLIDRLIKTSDRYEITKVATEIENKIEGELIYKGVIQKQNLDTWLRYQTKNKNKILFE